jgi:hypothetical protein
MISGKRVNGMLFDKEIPKICALCLYGQDYGENAILCSKKGPVNPEEHCSKFVYDPLRRKPAKGAAMKPVKDADAFKL